VQPSGGNSASGGTGGATDTFQANGREPPRYAQGQQLGQAGNTPVRTSREAGDYYCEHAFFITNEAANKPGSSILRDANGQAMSTFLHYPGAKDQPNASADVRHAETRQVVGTAIRGYVDQAAGQVGANQPINVMLTGYGTFGGAANNPTESFVSDPRNVDAAMVHGFGDALKRGDDGQPLRTQTEVNGQPVYRYTITDAQGRERNVDVMAARLTVDDNAINGGSTSLQSHIDAFQPNAVINMGVRPGGRSYDFETRADDGGMRRTEAGTYTDGSGSHRPQWEYENASGASAFERGAAAIEQDRTSAGSTRVASLGQVPITP
jgi:pyrrolidone-carboxylate peptidase